MTDPPEPIVFDLEAVYQPLPSALPATLDPLGGGAIAGPELVGEQLRYARGGRTILDGLDLVAHPGELLAVTGPSGSGKSSLLALLAGLERPDMGQVLLDGVPLAQAPGPIGLILQGYGLVGVLTAAENVEVALQARRHPPSRAHIRALAHAALDALGTADISDQFVDQLSGGQQQRVATARALVVEPRLLLADELTAELNHETKQVVLAQVRGLAERGATVIVATHDEDVAAFCDRQVALVDGRATI